MSAITTGDAFSMTLPLTGELEQPQPARIFSNFIAGLIPLLVAVLLLPLRDASSMQTTVLFGVIGALTMALALWIKYRNRWLLNSEVAILSGLTIQNFIAPALAILMSEEFQAPGFRVNGERWATLPGFKGAMLLVLVFAGVFLLVKAPFKVKRGPRYTDGRLASVFTGRSLIIFLALAFIVWTSRAALLATGSYYHLLRSRFSSEDSRYSGWAQADAAGGPVVVAFIWIGVFSKHVRLRWAILYTLADFFWAFASGSRERTVYSGAAILLSFIIYRNRLPWKSLLIAFFPLTWMLGFMDHYRYAIRENAQVNALDPRLVWYAMTKAGDRSESTGPYMTIQRGINRLNDLWSIARIYQGVPGEHAFLNGETYAEVPVSLVPRQFWPEKPSVTRPINAWFFINEGGSSPITAVGEGYFNYGLPGVILAGVLCALILLGAEKIMLSCLGTMAALPVYIGFVGIAARLHVQPMAIWVSSLLKVISLGVVFYLVAKPWADQDVIDAQLSADSADNRA